MILKNELLQLYKEYLISLDYPFIKQQNDFEIQKIFEKENRTLLLSWLIIKLFPSCNNRLEDSKKDNKTDSFLTNVIYENGFCRSTEKDGFVKGTLSDEKQIIIFNKMFHMLSLLHSTNTTQDNMSEEDLKLKQVFMKPSEELKKKIIPDVNLFPTFGLPDKMNKLDKQNKIDFYKEEIDNLSNILQMEEEKLTPQENITSPNVSCDLEDIKQLVTSLKKNIADFNIDDFVNFTDDKTGAVKPSNKTELENFVAVNSKEISSLLKTLLKKKDLNKFINIENVSQNDDSISEDNFSASILQNYVMSNKIIEEANRNLEH